MGSYTELFRRLETEARSIDGSDLLKRLRAKYGIIEIVPYTQSPLFVMRRFVERRSELGEVYTEHSVVAEGDTLTELETDANRRGNL